MTFAQDRILSAVDRIFDDQVQFLEKLVRFRSLRNDESAAQDFIAAALKERGFEISRLPTDASRIGKHPAFSPATVDYNDSWNVVGRKVSTGGGRSLAFNSHVDVVPAEILAPLLVTAPPAEPAAPSRVAQIQAALRHPSIDLDDAPTHLVIDLVGQVDPAVTAAPRPVHR